MYVQGFRVRTCIYLNTDVMYIPNIFAMHQIVAVSVVSTGLSILSRRPATTLDALQKKQKEIEEENQKKKVLLQQVLAERYCICVLTMHFVYIAQDIICSACVCTYVRICMCICMC